MYQVMKRFQREQVLKSTQNQTKTQKSFQGSGPSQTSTVVNAEFRVLD